MTNLEIGDVVAALLFEQFPEVPFIDLPEGQAWVPTFGLRELDSLLSPCRDVILTWADSHGTDLDEWTDSDEWTDLSYPLFDPGPFEDLLQVGWDGWADHISCLRPSGPDGDAYLLLPYNGELGRPALLVGRWKPWQNSDILRELLLHLIDLEEFAETFYGGVPTDVTIPNSAPLVEADVLRLVEGMAKHRGLEVVLERVTIQRET